MTRVAATLAALLCCSLQVAADTVVLDDSRSPRQQVSVRFEWVQDRLDIDTDADTASAMRALVGGLEFRLDTDDYVGRRVSIYLLFPRVTPGLDRGGSARLSWRTRGRLASGAVNQGDRALVFQGEVDSPLMIETFDFTIEMDSREVTGPLRLAPQFVLETE